MQSFRGPLAKDHMEEVVKHVSVFIILLNLLHLCCFRTPYYVGGQPDDERIIVEESVIEATLSAYTQVDKPARLF